MLSPLPDSDARTNAARSTDRNIVVMAGAGTGKTTLLVDRLIHLLFQYPHPLPMSKIVALTFTNKAANEMKVRLRERLIRLHTYAASDFHTSSLPQSQEQEMAQTRALLQWSQLAEKDVQELAGRAIRELERSQIGTIHGFAAHLLRLYPIQSAVDPGFQEDDGSQFSRYFEQEWRRWMDKELGPMGLHHETWRAALAVMTLDDMKALAILFTDELIPLDREWVAKMNGSMVPPPIAAWAMALARQGQTLRSTHEQNQTLERMLDQAIEVLTAVGQTTWPLECTNTMLERTVPSKTTTWPLEEYRMAKRIIRIASQMTQVKPARLVVILEQLLPFVQKCRQEFVQQGWISFGGLLARARNLVRDHIWVRRELKSQYSALLVDEFQDTDPVQYEFIIYLAEMMGQEATHWSDVQISPGKLFIVGDPKQSIYAFRRAEMEAYDRVVHDLILGAGRSGDQYRLQANFRSHCGLLGPINACFSNLFPVHTIKGFQPSHEPLLAVDPDAMVVPTEGMAVRLVKPEAPDVDVENASLMEAEELARWLRQEVLGQHLIKEQGLSITVQPAHMAILFRTLTHADLYIEALRRYDIPYAVEGEKHFYERQEVIDFINVLRAAILPHDSVAVIGVLRSPIGGMSDATIAKLAKDNQLNYREFSADGHGEVELVYAMLRELNHVLPCLPLPDVANCVLDRLPLLDFAAASIDGEQAVANLYKMRDIIEALAQQPNMTLGGIGTVLTERLHNRPPESESALIEEHERTNDGQGAIRLLSIHKAKGLEFPMVILAGLHRGTESREPRVSVQHDWSSGVLGVKVGELYTLGSVYTSDTVAQRQQAEQVRLLYVAMTRAKRRLVLSAGLLATNTRETMLTLLAQGMGVSWEALLQELNGYGTTTISLGNMPVSVEIVRGREPSFRCATLDEHEWQAKEVGFDVQAYQARWHERTRRCQNIAKLKPFGTVTAWQHQSKSSSAPLHDRDPSKTDLISEPCAISEMEAVGKKTLASFESVQRQRDRKVIGILAHRVLEGWDFTRDPNNLVPWIQTVWQRWMPQGSQNDALRILDTVQTLFRVFVKSAPYARLTKAEILGREIPFSIPWDKLDASSHRGTPVAVMEGTIDLIYRVDGTLWLADYKTDSVEQGQVSVQAARYHEQLQIYREAACRCLNLPALMCEVIFLRSGIAVTMPDA